MIQKQKSTISTQRGKKDEISSSSHASSTRDSSYPNETNVNSAEGEHLLDEKSKSKPRRRRDKRKPEHNLEGKNSAHQVLGPLIIVTSFSSKVTVNVGLKNIPRVRASIL